MLNDLTTYIDGLVEKVLNSSGYQNVSEEEKASIKETLESHFQRMITETAINRFSDDQAGQLKEVLENNPDKLEEKIEELSTAVPGLSVEIEERLNREVEHLQKLA